VLAAIIDNPPNVGFAAVVGLRAIVGDSGA
jgi:hypothetical protein